MACLTMRRWGKVKAFCLGILLVAGVTNGMEEDDGPPPPPREFVFLSRDMPEYVVTAGSPPGHPFHSFVTTKLGARHWCNHEPSCKGFARSVPPRDRDGDELQYFFFDSDLIWYFNQINNGEEGLLSRHWETFLKYDRPKICCKHLRYEEMVRQTDENELELVRQRDEVPREPCDVSVEDLMTKYILPRKPVVLQGCAKMNQWKGLTDWDFNGLREKYGGNSTWEVAYGDSGRHHHDVTLDEIEGFYKNSSYYYIFEEVKNKEELHLQYDIPHPAFREDLYRYREGVPPRNPIRRWFVSGPRYSGTNVHNDPCGTDAWNSLVMGHKHWVMFPAGSVLVDLMKCDFSCSEESLFRIHPDETISWFKGGGLDAIRNMSSGIVPKPVEVLQEPDETLFVPQGWVHAVFNIDHTTSITGNFASRGEIAMIWESVLRMLEHEEDRHRWEYWKVLYYSYFSSAERKLVRELEFPPDSFDFVGEAIPMVPSFLDLDFLMP